MLKIASEVFDIAIFLLTKLKENGIELSESENKKSN